MYTITTENELESQTRGKRDAHEKVFRIERYSALRSCFIQ